MMDQYQENEALPLNQGAFLHELDHLFSGADGGAEWVVGAEVDAVSSSSRDANKQQRMNTKSSGNTRNRSWELCDAEDWMSLQMRLATFPEEARTLTADRLTMLHVACCSSTVAPLTINIIYMAWPQALLLQDTLLGRTPLHCALSTRQVTPSTPSPSLDMICTILDLSQDSDLLTDDDGDDHLHEDQDMEQLVAQIQDNLGDTPLHAACRVGASKRVLWALIDACPSALLQLDKAGMTPLARLWTRLEQEQEECSGKIAHNLDHIKNWSDLVQTPEVKDAWDKVIVFLQMLDMWNFPNCAELQEDSEIENEDSLYSDFQNNSPELDFQILHVLVAQDCPSSLMSLALKLYPDDFLQLNEDGQSVLDAAIAAPLNRRPSSTEPSVIDILLNHDKSASGLLYKMCSSNNDRPLHRAISARKGWSEGVGSLLEAEAGVVTQADQSTGLYPFMMAAVGTDVATIRNRNALSLAIDTSFELLRQSPELIHNVSMAVSRSKPQNKKRRLSAIEQSEDGCVKKSASEEQWKHLRTLR